MRKSTQLDIFESSQVGREARAPKSPLYHEVMAGHPDRPLIVSLGMGVDSVGGTISMIKHKVPIDLIIFADTGAEKPETIDYIGVFDEWLKNEIGIGVTVCRLIPPKAPYRTLEEELDANVILPGIALGIGSCSMKWKQSAIHTHLKGAPASGNRPLIPGWSPAIAAWADGRKVIKFIGYDAGAKDKRRSSSPGDDKYDNLYWLREVGYDRLDCANEIISVGLTIPVKSACYFCSASKIPELMWLHHHHPQLFRKSLVIEQNALPRLTNSEGLWRKTRVSDGRPGNWKQWALQAGLIRLDDTDPDGFSLLPQSNPPVHYPDDEIEHLLTQGQFRRLAA